MTENFQIFLIYLEHSNSPYKCKYAQVNHELFMKKQYKN